MATKKVVYEVHEEITKELLDSIQVGDMVKCNDWEQPMQVKGVSANYFVMTRNYFGRTMYSICEKKPWGGIRYNRMVGGMFHVGTDNWVFGWGGWDPNGGYDFDDEKMTAKYLESLEQGVTELSMRTSIPLTSIAIKRKERRK